MKSSASKIKMTSFDDLFDTGENTGTPDGERILQIPVVSLFAFESHPFKVLDDEKMEEILKNMAF